MILELRDGVTLIRGRELQGSPWYLRDLAQDKEWNVSAQIAALISRKTDTQDETLIDSLRRLNVLQNAEIPPGMQGLNAQHLVMQKITLLRPDEWLKQHPGLVQAAFIPIAYIALSITTFVALATVASQWEAFYTYRYTYADATIAIITAIATTKALHEFGHACAISASGGKVSGMGIALIAGMPLPKTDASCLAHAPRSALIKIASAGVYFELWAAVIATILWGGMEDGILRSALHAVAVVSLGLTLVANALPLMKFDGYYLLSALTNEPRLYEDSIALFRGTVYTLVGKINSKTTPHMGISKIVRGMYGAAIFAWKVFLPFGIMLALRWYFPESNVGYIAGALPIYPMWIKPGINELRKLASADNHRNKTMYRLISITLIMAVIAWLTLPLPHIQIVQGAIVRDKQAIKAPVGGRLLYLRANGQINQGEVIARIEPNDSDLLRLSELENEHMAINVELSASNLEQNAYVLLTKRQGVAAQQKKITEQIALGEIRAAQNGYFQAEKESIQIRAGTLLGQLFPATGVGRLNVYAPENRGLKEYTNGKMLLSDGSTHEVRLHHSARHVARSMLPGWIDNINSDSLTLLTGATTYPDIPEMAVRVTYRRRYSILREWTNRYLARIL